MFPGPFEWFRYIPPCLNNLDKTVQALHIVDALAMQSFKRKESAPKVVSRPPAGFFQQRDKRRTRGDNPVAKMILE